MQKTKVKPVNSEKNNSPIREHLLIEGKLIAIVAISLYLLLALISYSSQDPGWSSTGQGGHIENLVGKSGAWIADVLFLLFGYLAYLFPLILLVNIGLTLRQRDNSDSFSWQLFAVRFIGFLLILAASTMLAVMHFDARTVLPESAGGVVGKVLLDSSLPAFDYLGSTLMSISFLLFGLSLSTGLSWLKVIDKVGILSLSLSQFLLRHWRTWREKAAKQKETRKLKEERKKVLHVYINKEKKRSAPKITPAPIKKVLTSSRVQKEKQGRLFDSSSVGDLPQINLLDEWQQQNAVGYSTESLEAMSKLLELKLKDFGIEVEVVAVNPVPVITRFEVQPAPGVKVSRISNLVKDLARSLAVVGVRVVEVIPGKTVIGIEIPNVQRETIQLSQVLSSPEFDKASSPLSVALGHDICGQPVVVDLAKMPHLLVAGTTGSGKSVGINAMILSLLFKASPQDVRLIMIDPKMLELSVYDGIPHLLTPVITDMKDAANGLRWCVAEMERRYKLLSALGVRNLAGFNKKVADAEKTGKPLVDPLWKPDLMMDLAEQLPDNLETLPGIVVIVDELADMMMVVGKKVEELIARIAQKARAAGIHLILATQRPSVDVLTGLIKANIPTRLSFMVQSKVDSRTILGEGGAEQLLGHGDMLYLPPGGGTATRIHGAFVSDDEVHRVVADWKKRGAPNYIGEITDESAYNASADEDGNSEECDDLYDQAVQFVTETRKASISAVQRKLRIGYNRAARMIEAMEMAGVVSDMGTNGSREVIAPPPFRD